MRRLAAFTLAATLLAGCGGGGPVALDIVSIDLPPSGMLGGDAAPGPGEVELAVDVRAGQLRAVLARGGEFDLAIFACAAPEGARGLYPLTFGGEEVAGMSARQISDDPEMRVRLNVAVPRRTLETPGRCARFVGREGAFAPEIVSQVHPLPAPTNAG